MNSLKWLEAWDLQSAVAAIAPVDPPPGLRDRLMARLAQAANAPIVEIRAENAKWRPSGMPGVRIQPLYKEAATGRRTFLLKLDAGATLPAHRHGADEQCFILSGDFVWEDLEYGPGDFVVLPAQSIHPRISSRGGATVLIVAGDNDPVGDEDEKG
jgi:anti-sigma factor ChrR (cupin superfamily)